MHRSHVSRAPLALVAFALLLGGATIAHAQSKAKTKAPAKAKATSDLGDRYRNLVGYSFQPPKNWSLENTELEWPEEMKERARKHNLKLEGIDVSRDPQFFRPSKPGEFRDNINVTIADPMPLTAELVRELRGILVDQYGKLFANFKLDAYERRRVGSHDVIYVAGNYTIEGFHVRLYQVLIPGPKISGVITCTGAVARTKTLAKLCDDVFASFKFE